MLNPTLPVRRAPVATSRITWILAAVAVVTSMAGILRHGDGWYDAYSVALAGLVGQDVATLLVGVPALVAAAAFARRGSVPGLLMWAAALFYFAYSYFFFVVGAFSPGFPAYVLIIALSLYGLLSLLLDIDPEAVAARFEARTPVRLVAGYLLVVGGLFAVMWTGMSVSTAIAGGTLDPVVRLVVVADGSVLVPALLAGGWKLWHRSAWGYPIAGIVLAKAMLTSGTVAFTTLLNAAWTGSLSGYDAFLAVLFGVVAAGAGLLLVPYLRAAGSRSS